MRRIQQHPIIEEKKDQKELIFTYNGQECVGYEGEMLSSALIANGIQHFSIHQKDNAKQGIFCANGQCSQCTVLVNKVPLKACITALKKGMQVETLVHLPALPFDTKELGEAQEKIVYTDVLIIGAGPSGLTSAIELAQHGFRCILVDDKDHLGGKLRLQTHKFFGSEEDCYAGTRGTDIADILENKVSSFSNIQVYTDTSVIGIYKDQKAGLLRDNKEYILVEFKGLLVSPGAREKSLVFHGNGLPGVYGAGAFQTLVNRDLVESSKRILVVGSGNVGLIASYHALQAGMTVVAIVEIASEISGYKVHADKIERLGVPLMLNTTILSAEGEGKVERVTIADVNENWQPILESSRTYEVDTVLIAAGLSPADEFYDLAENFGFKVIKAGDADEIAEASSAMFGGRIAGLKMAKLLGREVVVDDTYKKKADVLKSRPGDVFQMLKLELTESFQPNFFCLQEIPCNPCTTICPNKAITLNPKLGNILDRPQLTGDCSGCTLCVSICPGLAISLVRKKGNSAELILAHELIPTFEIGDKVPVTGINREVLGFAEVLKIRFIKKHKTWLITLKASAKNAVKIAGIKVQAEKEIDHLPETHSKYLPDDGIVCRCERVTLKEVVQFIKDNKVRDVNQLKQIRVGMGACGSKTCSVQLPRVFQLAGVDWNEVADATIRPLSIETSMQALINELERSDS